MENPLCRQQISKHKNPLHNFGLKSGRTTDTHAYNLYTICQFYVRFTYDAYRVIFRKVNKIPGHGNFPSCVP